MATEKDFKEWLDNMSANDLYELARKKEIKECILKLGDSNEYIFDGSPLKPRPMVTYRGQYTHDVEVMKITTYKNGNSIIITAYDEDIDEVVEFDSDDLAMEELSFILQAMGNYEDD